MGIVSDRGTDFFACVGEPTAELLEGRLEGAQRVCFSSEHLGKTASDAGKVFGVVGGQVHGRVAAELVDSLDRAIEPRDLALVLGIDPRGDLVLARFDQREHSDEALGRQS